jgi:drug/metabolite transporter (DMT)-like permease
MLTLALSLTHHTTLRLMEAAGAATAVSGALFFLGAGVPFGRRGGQALGGVLLAAAGVAWVVAVRWGRITP